jgi:hypothetical protein
VSDVEYVLHHWRPIRIYTNKKDQKLVVIGYFDRKVNNSVRFNYFLIFKLISFYIRNLKQRKNV